MRRVVEVEPQVELREHGQRDGEDRVDEARRLVVEGRGDTLDMARRYPRLHVARIVLLDDPDRRPWS